MAGGLTAEQQQVLNALNAQLTALNADVLATELEQIKLQDQRTQIERQIGVLSGQLAGALQAVIDARKQLDDFFAKHTKEDIAKNPELLDEYGR